ncbi:MAG: hypothetical protein JNL39_17565 [Opitutaceae bacterium]|nr:hypothetical protein [Opitutaceae bacterium]
MRRLSFILRVIYAVAFIYASVENITALVKDFPTQGWKIEGLSPPSTIYFHSLLVINPTIALLVLARAHVGLIAAGVVVATNIAHNTWLFCHLGAPFDLLYWFSVVFFMFYLSTVIFAWRGAAGFSAPTSAVTPAPRMR